jgi:hypothetical protein
MRSQKAAAPPTLSAVSRGAVVLLVLAWLLGVTLALQHRLGHAAEVAGHGPLKHGPLNHGQVRHGEAGHGHAVLARGERGNGEPHLVGGLHDDDDGTCRLVDQAGLGEALPSAPALLAALTTARPPAPPRPASWPAAAPWRPYEARAPPRG